MEARPLPRLALIVPCYNEQDAFPEALRRLGDVLDELRAAHTIEDGFLYFIDDGSDDHTWQLISSAAAGDSRIRGIKLSRNYGHQKALLAGLLHADGDALISVDADLQDDLAAVKEMLLAFARGAEIVYGVRRSRRMDARAKRLTAEGYYSFLRVIGVQLVFNHADYRLMSRRVVEALREFKEANVFLRGLIPQLGFPSALVYYDRRERVAGKSKYTVSKMLSLAIEGVLSFSDVPLRIITILGLVISLASFGMALWALWIRIFNPAAVPGWASIVIPLYMLGGVQLLCTGVLGQYLAKIYSESKARPRFIIEKIV